MRHRLTDVTLDQLQWIEIESNERLLRHQSSLPSSQPLTDWENVNNVIMMSQSEQLTRNTSITSSHLDSVSWQTEQVCFRNFWIFGPTQHNTTHKVTQEAIYIFWLLDEVLLQRAGNQNSAKLSTSRNLTLFCWSKISIQRVARNGRTASASVKKNLKFMFCWFRARTLTPGSEWRREMLGKTACQMDKWV